MNHSLQPQITSQTDETRLRVLIEKLASKNEREVEVAATSLIEMGDAGMIALLDTLSEQERNRKRHTKILISVVIGLVAVGFCFALVSRDAMSLLTMIPFFSFTSVAFATSVSQKQGVLHLSRMEDVRVVGVLTEALTWEDAKVVEGAKVALTRLLPRMKESDASYLPAERRKILHKQLKHSGSSPEFALAILRAFEQIGDETDISVVNDIATERNRYNSLSDVRDAATACLPYLRERAERKEQSQSLLRPAHREDAQPQILLRPASEIPHPEEVVQLLRPVE